MICEGNLLTSVCYRKSCVYICIKLSSACFPEKFIFVIHNHFVSISCDLVKIDFVFINDIFLHYLRNQEIESYLGRYNFNNRTIHNNITTINATKTFNALLQFANKIMSESKMGGNYI